MASTDGVLAAIGLENREPSALFEKFLDTDIHIWPYLRWPLVQSMAAIELGSSPISAPISTGQRLAKLVKRALPNPSSATHAPRNRRMLFVVAGRTQADTSQGRKNWLVDDFASAYAEDSVVVQYREMDRRSPSAKRVFEHTYSFHDAELKGDIRARLRPLSARKDSHTREIIESVYSDLDFTVGSTGVAVATAKVLRHQARVEAMRRHYEALLDRVSPEVIIMDGAAYGGSRAIQVRAAKARGIPVAELQHGWIGPSHGAYNFGSAMWRQELQQYLPDYLLTFGEFWSNGVSGPFTTVAVGKPHLDQLAAGALPVSDRRRAVVVASSVTDRQATIRAVLSIRQALPDDWRVLFRPHPSERSTVARLYPDLVNVDRVEIDATLDVYETLRQVRGVFGYSSTVLYEALKFGCPTFVLESPLAEFYAAPEAFGESISTQADLDRAVSLICADSPPQSTSHDNIWAPSSLERFRDFIDTVGERH